MTGPIALLEIAEVYTGFWSGKLRKVDDWKDRQVVVRIFRKWEVGIWTGLIWFGIGTGGGHF